MLSILNILATIQKQSVHCGVKKAETEDTLTQEME